MIRITMVRNLGTQNAHLKINFKVSKETNEAISRRDECDLQIKIHLRLVSRHYVFIGACHIV